MMKWNIEILILVDDWSYKLISGESSVVDPDPHQSDKLDPNPDPDPHQCEDHKPKYSIWNMRQFEHLFKVLSLYLEARIRIRIKVTSRIRIRNNGRKAASWSATGIIINSLS
jgi:hypothetical protein